MSSYQLGWFYLCVERARQKSTPTLDPGRRHATRRAHFRASPPTSAITAPPSLQVSRFRNRISRNSPIAQPAEVLAATSPHTSTAMTPRVSAPRPDYPCSDGAVTASRWPVEALPGNALPRARRCAFVAEEESPCEAPDAPFAHEQTLSVVGSRPPVPKRSTEGARSANGLMARSVLQ